MGGLMSLSYLLMKCATLAGGKMRPVVASGAGRNLAPQDDIRAQRANLKLALLLAAAVLSIGPIAVGWPLKATGYIQAAWHWFRCLVWGC